MNVIIDLLFAIVLVVLLYLWVKSIAETICDKTNKNIAIFNKVSLGQFHKDWTSTFDGDNNDNNEVTTLTHNIHQDIVLPTRATTGSAGYDFSSPLDFTLKPGETIKIPTGVRCNIEDGWVLNIYPRSSIGFKYETVLVNTVGIIDSDYFYGDNEGHIFIKLKNTGKKNLHVEQGERFAQGVFVQYGTTVDDDVTAQRTGGIGSSGK